ncbi:monovalent inorganic cation transporter [Ceraceosorus bombacis]|uniref:Sodium/hydrogen exchanger n=1 Tax=Ceraceosorus bombacis TaxID=401625 RepID=A0A0P1BH32_9BASI|nr:monovalent inorganic cation transporter [Ceraceosorus bombacis]
MSDGVFAPHRTATTSILSDITSALGEDATQILATATSSGMATSTATLPAAPVPPPAEQAERDSSLALFLVLLLLILSFWASYYLKLRRITSVHETLVGLFAGMLVGAALRIGPGVEVQRLLSFSNTIMLNVLLPPIILASGYDLRQESFFRNFGTILTFAFAGTFISAIVIGVLVYVWSMLHLESLSLTLLECLIFGSTLSATDPVTILAIFNTYKVDPQLYSVIFGESILNDAVSIVMFDVLSTFRGKPISIASLFHGFGLFLFTFTFSMALGISFGLGCSLMLKHSRLSLYPQLESCLVALIAYTSYFFSNGVGMGGIVSLLFCGITLKHYAYHNMSRRTQRATRYIFQTLSSLSENFIFIYLGLSLFTQDTLVYKPLFIVVTVAAVVASRYCAVFPLAALVNAIKRARNLRRARRSGAGALRASNTGDELPREYQIMLFWAGLRGAVGFALSAGIVGQNAAALQTTVLVAVVTTVVAFGGTTPQMLEILGIRTGVEDDDAESSDEESEHATSPTSARLGVRHRSSGRARNRFDTGKRSAETRALYHDQSGDYDDDELGSAGSEEVLPRSASLAGPSLGSGAGDLDAAAEAGLVGVGGEEDRSVRAFLDRAGLIMRDGRWFSTLDQRYLTPLFTNSVASRKHEERRAARRASANAAAMAAADMSGEASAWGVPKDAWAPPGERDADAASDDAAGASDDDAGGGVRSLGHSTNRSSSGRLPIKRAGSRGGSDDDLTVFNSRSGSAASTPVHSAGARMSGAFAPSSADNSSSAWATHRP